MKNKMKEDWVKKFEEEIEKRFYQINREVYGVEIWAFCREFIEHLLQSEKQKLLEKLREKIEKRKRDDPWAYEFNVDMTSGFNQAIDEILELLK